MDNNRKKTVRLLTDEELTKVTGGTTIPSGNVSAEQYCASFEDEGACQEASEECVWFNETGCTTDDGLNEWINAHRDPYSSNPY